MQKNRTLLEELIYAEIDRNFVTKNNNITNKGYTNHIDIVNTTMLVRSNRVVSPQDLINKYLERSKNTLATVKQLTGVDVSSLKRNGNFTKDKICLLTICFNLSFLEAQDLLLACSINLNPTNSVYDCVYMTYIKNQDRNIDVAKRINAFMVYQSEAEIYVRSKNR